MRKSKWLLVMLSVMMVASLALAACGGGGGSSAEPGGDKGTGSGDGGQTSGDGGGEQVEQVLRLIESQEPPDLDSAKTTDTVSFTILNNVNEGLMRLDENNEPIPGIAAEEPEISEDGLHYTFKLRDAKWSDGTPVTAHDFEYAWKRALNPDTASQYAYMLYYLKNGEAYNTGKAKADDVGVKAVDEKTLEVELETPIPFFTSLMAFTTYFPQKQEFVESQGDAYAKEDDALLFNGPFKLENWQHESGWELVKNEDYWDADTVKLEKITFDIVKETSTAVNLYETGEVDRAGLSAEYVDQFKDREDYQERTEYTEFYIVPNMENEFLANDKIRKAIASAFDREAHAEVILNNGSVPAYGLVPPGMPGPEGQTFREANGDIKPVGSVEEAKQLFDEGLKELGMDKPPKIEYLTDDTDAARKTAEFLQEEWRKNLGLEVEINQQTFASRLDLSDEGKFDLVLSGWGADFNDPMSFMDLFVTDGGHNDGKWSNKEYDEAIKFGKSTTDYEERMQRLLEVEKILIEDAGIMPLYFRARAYLWQPYVKNMIKHPYGADWTFKWAYIEK